MRALPERAAWTLFALLPGTVLLGLAEPGRGSVLVLAVLLAVAIEAVALRLAGRPARELRDGGAVLTGLLIALLIPLATPMWLIATAVLVAVLGSRVAFGGAGGIVLHPAMLGLAVAALAPLTAPPPAVAAVVAGFPIDARHVAAAFAAGGLLLLALRILRWQAPLALLATLALFATLAGGELHAAFSPLAAAGTWLVAIFVAGDGASGCVGSRGRLAFGTGVGALALPLLQPGDVVGGLVPAVLLMNLLAPALDRWLAPAPPQVDA
ncbi:RnfABCDGE type electron transport complex subunit D [Arenimonas composti]|uniref:Uncharacterized protein n=1 Tax=Arenimonas composti TR7-09 = DSM 18010 TaxID=1121013 RepID=A0A091BF18_9GAMM|nr:RnfABCDGE type electron transport complex subunit D [Arenimonas composti]KFN50341.1 hypothetical protein P873_06615 [Arenimonas composti TR7-09 = DSM 18010]